MADFISGSRDPFRESPEQRRKERQLRKIQTVMLSSRQSLIPFICRILFIMMIVAPLLDLIMEINLQLKDGKRLDSGAFLLRISWSLLAIWGFFALIIMLLSVIQLIRIWKFGYEERVYRFKYDLKDNEQYSDFDMVERPESEIDRESLTLYSKVIPGGTKKRYLRYLIVSGAGLLVFSLFYLICLSL